MPTDSDNARADLTTPATILTVGAALFLLDMLVGHVTLIDGDTAAHYRDIAAHVGWWRLDSALTAIGALLALAGLIGVSRALGPGQRRLARVVVGAMSVFTAAYLVEVAVRLTYTVATASNIAAGAPVHDTFPQNWGASVDPQLYVLGLFLFVALGGLAVATRRAGLVGSRLGWACTLTAATGPLGDLPLTFAICALPLAVAVLVRARRARAELGAADRTAHHATPSSPVPPRPGGQGGEPVARGSARRAGRPWPAAGQRTRERR